MRKAQMATRSSVRRWRGVTIATALAAAAVVGVVGSASAAPATVTGGTVTWGVRQVFRSYIVNPMIANGSITTTAPATQAANNGVFTFPVASGSYDATGTTQAATSGGVAFSGHHGVLDIRLSDIRVNVSGNSGTIVADVVSRPFTDITATVPEPAVTYNDVVLGNLSLAGVTPAVSGNTVTYANVPVTLAASGVAAFGSFYAAGESFDPISFTLNVSDTPAPPPPTTPTAPSTIQSGSMRWILAQSAWENSQSTASLNQCLATLEPATTAAGDWNDPAAGAVFTAAGGSFDAATGATSLQLTGTLQVGNYNRGGYRIQFTDPTIVIDANGEGTLSANVRYSLLPGGATVTTGCDDERTWSATVADVELVTFPADAATRTADGDVISWTLTPRWADADPAYQFSQALLDALVVPEDSPALAPWFQATASSNNPVDPNSQSNLRKVPAPIHLSFSLAPPPPSTSVDIVATVPGEGALVINVANAVVNLPPLTLATDGSVLQASGTLGAVTVTDTRLANPGWNVNAQLTDFVGAAGVVPGSGLGWVPSVTSSDTGQTVAAGATVAPGIGISGATLASALSGQGRGSAVLDAQLNLHAPAAAEPGTYTATLTLTTI